MEKFLFALLCVSFIFATTQDSYSQVLQSIESETEGNYTENSCFSTLKVEIQLSDYANGFVIPPNMAVGFLIENGSSLYTPLTQEMFDPATGIAIAEVYIGANDFNEDCIDNFFEATIMVNVFWDTPSGYLPVNFCTDFTNRPNHFTPANGPCDISQTVKLSFCCE